VAGPTPARVVVSSNDDIRFITRPPEDDFYEELFQVRNRPVYNLKFSIPYVNIYICTANVIHYQK
jgi:hypothetical protein